QPAFGRYRWNDQAERKPEDSNIQSGKTPVGCHLRTVRYCLSNRCKSIKRIPGKTRGTHRYTSCAIGRTTAYTPHVSPYGAQAVSGPIQTTPTEYRQNPQRHSPTAGLCSTQFETRRYARHGDRAPQVKQKAIQGPFGHSGIVSPAGYHV